VLYSKVLFFKLFLLFLKFNHETEDFVVFFQRKYKNKKLKKLDKNQTYKIKMDKIKSEFIGDKYKIVYIWETDIKNKSYKNTLWNLLK